MTPLRPRRNAVNAAGEVAVGAPALLGFGLEFVFEEAHVRLTSAGCFVPPVIAMPSSSSLASGANSPTILPS